MATLREYYDTDFSRCLKLGGNIDVRDSDKRFLHQIPAHVCVDMDSTACFLCCYFAELPDPSGIIEGVIRHLPKFLADINDQVQVKVGNALQKSVGPYHRIFSNVVYIYYIGSLTDSQIAALDNVAHQLKLSLIIRDESYRAGRDESEHPLAFLSHDSRDKDSIVRPLAQAFAKRLCPVWYDEFSLKVGDSLRESIERGIKSAKKCILILSPNFLANSGWTKAEFDSVYQREVIEGKNVILPIWAGVTKEEVYGYSPRLVDRMAHIWSNDPDVAVDKLIAILRA